MTSAKAPTPTPSPAPAPHPSGPPEIKYCLFDSDGLLLDTERLYTEVTQSILSRYGIEYGWKTKQKLMGLAAMAAAKLLVEELNVPMTPEEYLEERNAKQLIAFRESKQMPGALRLVSHLSKHGVPIAVASSSHSSQFAVKSEKNMDLFDHFHHITLGDDPDLKNSKPMPDIYLLAARRLGVPEGEEHKCLVFEGAGVLRRLDLHLEVVLILF